MFEIDEAMNLVYNKDYSTLALDSYAIWEVINPLCIPEDMPFDESLDEFISRDENQEILESDEFQLAMLMWLITMKKGL